MVESGVNDRLKQESDLPPAHASPSDLGEASRRNGNYFLCGGLGQDRIGGGCGKDALSGDIRLSLAGQAVPPTALDR